MTGFPHVGGSHPSPTGTGAPPFAMVTHPCTPPAPTSCTNTCSGTSVPYWMPRLTWPPASRLSATMVPVNAVPWTSTLTSTRSTEPGAVPAKSTQPVEAVTTVSEA